MRTLAGPFAGSSDALALADLARRAAHDKRMVAVVSADPLSAQRLADEIPWFAPELRVALLPDWETLPYDQFSPHQDLVSERLATLYRISRGECDVVVVAATTALYRLAPPSYLAAFTFFLTQGTNARRRRAARAADARRLRARDAGRVARRVQRARRADRSLPDGLRAALPPRSLRQRHRDDQDLRRRHAAHALSGARRAPAARARVPAGRRRAHPLPQPLSRGVRGRSVEVGALQGHQRTASCPAASSTTCRCSSTGPRCSPTTCRPSAIVALHGDVAGAVDRFWQDTESRYRLLRGDKARPLLPPTELFVPADEFNGALKAFGRVELRREGRGADRDRCRRVQVDRRAADPLAALKRFLATTPLRVAHRRRKRRPARDDAALLRRVRPRAPRSADGLRTRSSRRASTRDAARRRRSPPASRGPTGDLAFVTESRALRGRRAPHGARGREAQQRRRDGARPLGGAHRRPGRARAARHRPLPGPRHARPRRRAQRVPAARLRQRRQAVRAGVEPASHQPLQRRVARRRAAARARAAASGRRRRRRRRSRRTTPRRSCSTSTRSARRGRATRSRSSRTTTRPSPKASASRRRPTRRRRSRRSSRDMTSGKPMDRLVCGDVGFGKTEVALRAAFVALADGKQVALLVPTTLLAEQHFQTFSDRFADLPVRIAELSRFRTAQGDEGRARGPGRGHDRHRDRHAQAAAGRRQVQGPGPRHHRRGAPLRRAPEGAPEAPARRGGRADAHRDADPAHARDVARRASATSR